MTLASRGGELPADFEACRVLGVAWAQCGELDGARRALERACAMRPGDAGTRSDLGNVLRLDRDYAGAGRCYEEALEIEPAAVSALSGLAALAYDQDRHDDAERWYRRLLEIEPDNVQAIRHLAYVFEVTSRPAAARAVFEGLVARAPASAEARRALGIVLRRDFLEPVSALEHLDAAIAGGLADPGLLVQRGIALQELGRIDEAIVAYDAALTADPGHKLGRFHRSLALLLQRDYARAWDDYELRLQSLDRPARKFPFPRWDGSDLAGRTLLVHAEQGVGDEIMFASCIPDVMARGGRVVIDCLPSLEPLFRRSFPAAVVHGGSQHAPIDWIDALGPVDLEIPAGSLPGLFRRSLESFPAHDGYLRADDARTTFWRGRIEGIGARKVIGLSWRGGTRASRSGDRSLSLRQLLPVLDARDTAFVSLQYDSDGREEEAFFRETGIRVLYWKDALDRYDETASLVNALDQVLSVCTAVIHLAGSLGRPVWIMAPHSPEWRYGAAGASMPWYPSATVMRQPSRGDWTAVIDAVRERLRADTQPGGA